MSTHDARRYIEQRFGVPAKPKPDTQNEDDGGTSALDAALARLGVTRRKGSA